MKITIAKDVKIHLCIGCLYYVLFIGFFTYNFRFPQSLLYVSDGILMVLFFLSIPKINYALRVSLIRETIIPAIGIAVISTASSCISNINILQIIWAYRNWGRLFIYFLVCYIALKKELLTSIIKFLKTTYHLNFLVIVLQYLSHSAMYTQDQLNGFFGRDTSAINTTVSLFILVVVLSDFFSKKASGLSILPYIIEITIIAILAELKAVMIFEILLILVFMLVNTTLDTITVLKQISFALVLIITVIIGSQALSSIYPDFKNFLNIQNIILSATTSDGYGHSGYIDRLNGIEVINKYFFDSMGWKYKLIGLGAGNAEYSAVPILQSDFYKAYGSKFLYLNFASSSLYLESGMLGLIGYALCFILPLISYTRRIMKQPRQVNAKNTDMTYWLNVGLGSNLIALLFIIYNNLERTDASLIVAFFVAAPIVAIYKQRING